MSRSARKHVTPPLAPFSLSVTAKTMQKSAMSPPVMNVFSPLITQSSPSRTAVVRRLRASDPAPGSVIAKQLIFSPSIVGLRYAAFCSSLAWNRMLSASPPNLNWTNDRPSSASISAAITAPRPIPPYSSGVCTPKNPDSRAFPRNARSSSSDRPRSLRRSRSSTVCSSGMISLVTNVRTHSRISRSSGLRLRSMPARLPVQQCPDPGDRVIESGRCGRAHRAHVDEAVHQPVVPDGVDGTPASRRRAA